MIAKAGQIIAIDSVKVDNTLSGDGIRTPLGVKATAPAVSGHAGLSAEKVDNTVYIGMEPGAVKVVSTDETVSIHKDIEEDGTVKYNLGVSIEPVVSDTKINGGDGIKVYSGASATFTISISGDYVKSETLNDYYTKTDADETFQPKGDYVEETEIQDMATETWVGEHYVPNNVLKSYYTKQEVDDLIPDTSNFALSADVDTAINEATDDVCTWAEETFAIKSDITGLSATVETNFQEKGKYVTSADDSLSGKALVLKNNKWEEAPAGTTYIEGPNIDIEGTVISGRDWFPELNLKADKTELEDLATQDDLDELSDVIATNLAEALEETSAWANRIFQPIGNYLTDDALEDYYTKTEVDGKVEELANEFENAIDSVSGTIDRNFALKTELEGKLDKSETTNWDVKEYSAGENITILNHKISGKDWSTEIDAKQDKLTDKQLSAISSVSAIEAMSGKWVTSGDTIVGDYYYGLVNKDGTVEWDPIPEPDYPNIVGNNGISAIYDSEKKEYDVGLSADYALKSELPDVSDFITKDVDDLTYYYKKTESDGRYIQKNTDSTLSGDGTTNNPLGIDTTNMVANKQYAFTTTGWEEVQGGGGGGSYTAGDGIDITNDVISFDGAAIDPEEQIIVGNGTIENPLSTSAFANALNLELDDINDAISDLAAEVAALGGTIILRGRASCQWLNNVQAGSFQTGDAYIATDSGQIWSYDHTTGQGENINVSAGDMVVFINYDNNREVAVLSTTPDLDTYAQKTELPVVEGGANVVVTETTMSTGAKKYTVAAIGGGTAADMSYVVNSSDQRIDVTDTYDAQTNCRTFTLSADMPHFEAVTKIPDTITPNTYYFVYEE